MVWTSTKTTLATAACFDNGIRTDTDAGTLTPSIRRTRAALGKS
jgi:hypothetical protein